LAFNRCLSQNKHLQKSTTFICLAKRV